MERCVCVSGERGWISDVVSFPLKILAVLSRLGEESNSKIIWRCWVKVKKKTKKKNKKKTLDEFISVFILFY